MESGLSKAHFYGFMYGLSQSILFYAFAATFTFGGWLCESHMLTYEKGKLERSPLNLYFRWFLMFV